MPGVVPHAAPATVLPAGLCAAFRETRAYEAALNEYPEGESQREARVSASRRRWALSRLLAPADLATLRTFFWTARHGPFWFYDGFATTPLFKHDPTGNDPDGRVPARFEGPWEQFVEGRRGSAGLEIVELSTSGYQGGGGSGYYGGLGLLG